MAKLTLKYVHSFVDRHGHARHYFRHSKVKPVALPGLPGSEEFMAAYQGALANIAVPQDIGSSRTAPGTIDALVVTYYRSEAWLELTADTQKTRRRYIERFREKNGTKRVVSLTREHIEKMMTEMPKAGTRRHWLKAIRHLLGAAVPSMLKTNPTDGIKLPKVAKTKIVDGERVAAGHHSWTTDEIDRYRAFWPNGTPQRLVFEFALEAVSRRAEIVRLGPQHIRDGWIRIERVHGSADVEIPVTPELAAACDAMPRTDLLFLPGRGGRPRSPASLGNDFRDWATQAGLPARCRLHGLKKGGMSRLAQTGSTTHELMGVSGHKTLAMVQLYTEGADRKRLAASAMQKKAAAAD